MTIETYAKQLIEIGDDLQIHARVSDASLNTCEFMNNNGILVEKIGKDILSNQAYSISNLIMETSYGELFEELATLRAENNRLRKALRPFAAVLRTNQLLSKQNLQRKSKGF